MRGKFFRIGSDEFALISLLDGKNTIAQAIGLSAEALQEKAFIENEAMSVCHWLLESQLAVCGGGGQGERLATSARKLAQNKLAASINPLVHAVAALESQRRAEPDRSLYGVDVQPAGRDRLVHHLRDRLLDRREPSQRIDRIVVRLVGSRQLAETGRSRGWS